MWWLQIRPSENTPDWKTTKENLNMTTIVTFHQNIIYISVVRLADYCIGRKIQLSAHKCRRFCFIFYLMRFKVDHKRYVKERESLISFWRTFCWLRVLTESVFFSGFMAFWRLSWTAWQGWLQLTLICICKWPGNSFRLPNAHKEAPAFLKRKCRKLFNMGEKIMKCIYKESFIMQSVQFFNWDLHSSCVWWGQCAFTSLGSHMYLRWQEWDFWESMISWIVKGTFL